ncbi:glycosyltransferase [Bifidobacterium pullorum]|uniref:glycosyltransferase n=1 Tax=Bifidobacterium pullorum TaxID=78448 RepID=UPI002942B32E|nr:glycosyltransferase [Bifidobacterium pullorum]
MARKALIVVNLAGFLCFLRNDFELLKSMGYEIEVAADGRMADGGEAVELPKLRDAGIPFHQIDIDSKNPLSKASLGAYKQLRAVIREGRFDFIACHTPISGLLTRVAAQRERRKHGTKVIYTTHGFAFCKGTSWKSWMVYFPMEYVMSAFCDAIVTINSEDRRNAERMLCRRVYQLPGVGVDIDRMRMDAGFDRDAYRASIGVDRDDVMVLSVGELSARKNHRVIIEALGLLPDRQRYVYIVCGRDVSGTGLAETLSRRAVELGVRVRFLGHRSDIPEINNCADIAAIPSLREGLGLAGIEALAAGVPVIGSDVQGIRDYVIPGKTGYLCNAFDAEQFADAISRLSESITNQQRSECRRVANKFNRYKSYQILREIYTTILQ